MADRPRVVFDPRIQFGEPHIGGASVAVLGEQVWAGASVDETADEFRVTRADVVVACWWLGRHGSKGWRRRWKGWAVKVDPELWAGRFDVEGPPDVRDAG